MRKLLLLAAMLLPCAALAQTVPNIPETAVTVNGQHVTSRADLAGVFGTKLDAAPVAAVMPKFVFLGSTTSNYANLITPSSNGQSIAAGSIGLYQHANGNAVLSAAQRSALWAAWSVTGVTPTGQGQSVGEVGGFTPVPASYLAYFGGKYPSEVNMNIITGSGDGSGSYAAVAGDAHPGTSYTGYTTAADLATEENAITAAVAAGAKNVAIYITPNGGGEDLDDAFATSPYWANVRTAALFGGGLALDVPPTYWGIRGAAYQSIVSQMIGWANDNHLRSSLTISNYAASNDPSGHSGGAGYDVFFQTNTQSLVLYLQVHNTLPSQWIVENYSPGGTGNDIAADGTPNSLNAVALYLARTLGATHAGTATPGVAGGQADAGMMDTAVMISPIRASMPVRPLGPLTAFDILGLGQMATQPNTAVNIAGGTVANVNLNNVNVTGNSSISTTATPIFQSGIIVQSMAAGGGIFYINGDTAGGNTIWLTKPGGAPADLRVDSIGSTPNTRPGSINTINLDASGAVALGGLLTIGAQGRSALATSDPHHQGQLWLDSTLVLHVSGG